MTDDFAIFINGTYGVGKTSVLDHIGDRLEGSARPFALMDVDWFHRSWPPAHAMHGNALIELENMAAVWRNYRTVGPRRLVISGVIESKEDLHRYSDALSVAIRPVLLVADRRTVFHRLRRRYSPQRAGHLQWHLERASGLQERLIDAAPYEARFDTTSDVPAKTAQRIIEHFASGPEK
ncbi:hypothetical protein [Zhihengliuella halotolerans]|uniref:Shikimate kinase n=1 Tax=Zhihengliuella halotolerans TaxID=370736 RepID=A0A4Q8ACB9_9MICC|nr:hypothetical protein [Zhihengliuella halotolerans]RZU61243.1 hypothetical protein EV380_0806 [Zhihengliuella halotolerans]